MSDSAIHFLFCNHPIYQRQVDEDYQSEYDAARERFSCALFSYEDLCQGKLSLYGERISGLTIYRGWMMEPELYRNFYRLLEERDIILINTPEEYERYHLLPNWYEDFVGLTPQSVWTDSGSVEKALELLPRMEGACIVKDYVKSRKHEWYDACYIPDAADQQTAGRVIENFVSRQGESLVGGVVLRRFEPLRRIGFHDKSGMPISEEYRVFVYEGRILIVDDYWADRHDVRLSEEEKRWIETLAAKVRSHFVTIDLARREDGSLTVMELGDGQVSGLQQIEATELYKRF
ncbi:MAG: ATP-grasp domain-containing protein [Butyrivibrio sp.]|nr:ATP-grasp domain-containing protein [Butyrivibrio sp.]